MLRVKEALTADGMCGGWFFITVSISVCPQMKPGSVNRG